MYKEIIIPIIIAFAISALIGPFVIPFLKKIKFGQTIRNEGPQTHLKKTGTPVMGGFIFLISIGITSLLFCKEYPMIIPVLLVTLGYGLVGFMDDYIKVVLKRSMGLRAWQKMLGQIVVTTGFAIYMVNFSGVSLALKIPFCGNNLVDIGWFAIPLLFFIALGTVNGTNFTDGLDGLLSSVTIAVALFFAVVAYGASIGVEPIVGALIGALLGFLLYNVYPAKVFMGDTGSLALGGFVLATAYLLQMPLFIPAIGIIYMVEVLSVIIQVTYFKKTGGKRFFKMAPIHHHFELYGWSETRVVAVFTIVTTIMCLIGLLAI